MESQLTLLVDHMAGGIRALWAYLGLRTGNTAYQPLRLPGQTAEQLGVSNNQTGRYFNNARWFRPGWGRFTQPDPLRMQIARNTYQYALDNPIANYDPSGLRPRKRIFPKPPTIPRRPCNEVEYFFCSLDCGFRGGIVDHCSVARRLTLSIKDGKVVPEMRDDGQMTCSCKYRTDDDDSCPAPA